MTDSSDPASGVCTTGVEGLDQVLEGGLPRNCLYLVQGDPGSGKTTLALQFLLEGVRRGERVFYITLSETKSELEKVARSHDWSLERIPLLELSAIDSLLRPEAQTTVFHASEVELSAVTKLLLSETRKHRPTRVVFDSLSEFRLMAETPLRYRRQLLTLKQELAAQGSTALLLDDKMDSERIGADPHVLSLTHGVLEMEQLSPDYGRSRRRLRVMKMRAVAFREGYHDYVIERGGLRIFPRLIAAEHRANLSRQPVRSGIDELDELFGGGLDRGTTTLIVGQAGTGKSTLALQFATQMASAGDRSVVFSFDETAGIALARARALGLGFPEFVSSGTITLQQVDPAEISRRLPPGGHRLAEWLPERHAGRTLPQQSAARALHLPQPERRAHAIRAGAARIGHVRRGAGGRQLPGRQRGEPEILRGGRLDTHCPLDPEETQRSSRAHHPRIHARGRTRHTHR